MSALAYDKMGRLIGTSKQYTFLSGYNFQNSHTYDAASIRTSLTAPDGSTNMYQYDTLNRLSSLTNSLTGQFGFGFDAPGRSDLPPISVHGTHTHSGRVHS
jgi:hypothetical protein